MSRQNADETVTVRMPAGTADKLRAITGQPFSRLVRFTMLALLDKYQREGRAGDNAKAEIAGDIAAVIKEQR